MICFVIRTAAIYVSWRLFYFLPGMHVPVCLEPTITITGFTITCIHHLYPPSPVSTITCGRLTCPSHTNPSTSFHIIVVIGLAPVVEHKQHNHRHNPHRLRCAGQAGHTNTHGWHPDLNKNGPTAVPHVTQALQDTEAVQRPSVIQPASGKLVHLVLPQCGKDGTTINCSACPPTQRRRCCDSGTSVPPLIKILSTLAFLLVFCLEMIKQHVRGILCLFCYNTVHQSSTKTQRSTPTDTMITPTLDNTLASTRRGGVGMTGLAGTLDPPLLFRLYSNFTLPPHCEIVWTCIVLFLIYFVIRRCNLFASCGTPGQVVTSAAAR